MMNDNLLASERQESRLYYLALLFSVLFLVRFVTLWEPYRDLAEIFRYFAWLFCSLVLLSSLSQYKPIHRLLIISFVLLSIFVGVNCDRLEFMFYSSSLMVGAKNIKYDNIIKVYFIIGLSFCLFNIIGNQLGAIKDADYLDQSDRLEMLDDMFLRKSFGYDWCSDFASHVFLIILSYWICKKGILKFYEIFVFIGIAFFILIETGTRMAAACIILVSISSLYCRYRNPQKISKIVWYLLVLSTPFFLLLSLYLTLSYDDSDIEWLAVDVVMSGRLRLGQDAILEEGIPWLGQIFVMYGMGSTLGGNEYNYVDNTYVQYLVVCGILATMVFVICYIIICYKAYLYKQLYLIMAVLLSGLFGIITQFHFNIAYCPLLLATCATLDVKASDKGGDDNTINI